LSKVADAGVAPRQRGAALELIRNKKMARSAFDYVRVSPTKFYEWLSKEPAAIPSAPKIWICGDCHVGNLGPTANAEGKFKVEIRDFDQTVIGNPAHDLVRLGLSLASKAVVSDLPGLTIAEILEAMSRHYEAAFDAVSDETADLDEPEMIRKVNRRAAEASWETLAKEDTEGKSFKLPIGKRFWPLFAEERREIQRLFRNEEMRRLVTGVEGRDEDADIRIVDAAYWRKGCSSLGHLRYSVLLQIGSKSDRREHCLMDLKEAVKPQAPHASGGMPRDYARRVMRGASHLSPHLGSRIRSVELVGKPVFVRELLPQDLKIEIEALNRKEAARVAGYLAAVVGKAHARQMGPDARKDWGKELRRNRVKSLDAPTWLWRSVVDLLMDHQNGYLEHCRAGCSAGPNQRM
jgi:uncharacterized protein (DUF2252 family)